MSDANAPFYDSHGREIKTGDEAIIANGDKITKVTIGELTVGHHGNQRIQILMKRPDGKTGNDILGEKNIEVPNGLVSLTAQKDKRPSKYLTQTEYEGRETVKDAILQVFKERGFDYDGRTDVIDAIRDMLPENAFATADQIIQIVEDSRASPFAQYEQTEKHFDIAFTTNVLKHIKVKEGGVIKEYPEDKLKGYALDIIEILGDKNQLPPAELGG